MFFVRQGQQGVLFRTQDTVFNGTETNIVNAGDDVFPIGSTAPQPDFTTNEDVTARLNIVGSTIVSNGTPSNALNSDGILLAIGSATRQNVLISGVNTQGNVASDFAFFPFVSANPFSDSVNNTTPTADLLRLDPVAQLDLVFGSITPSYNSNLNSGTFSLFATGTPAFTPFVTRNTGEQVTGIDTGFGATSAIANSSGLFTNADALKGANRSVRLTGQVQIAPLSNTGSNVDGLNQFIETGVEQDLDLFFNALNPFTVDPAQSFPDAGVPQ